MKKKYYIPLLILIVLLATRIALPFWVTGYLNRMLRDIPGYTGSVGDVDMHLYRGAYTIDSLKIDKLEGDDPVPFISVPRIDLSVQWSAIVKGAIVGEIDLISPELNFVGADEEDEEQFGQNVDWTQPIKDLMPLHINRFTVRNGRVRYLDYDSEPEINLSLNNLALTVLNLDNAEKSEETLPSRIELTATSIGDGKLNITADANLLKPVPDIDFALEFQEVYLPDLNDFLEAYAMVDAEDGTFNLYSEFAVNDGSLNGYVKPIITGLKVLSLKKEDGNAVEMIWEGIVGFVSEIFENQPKDQFATRVPISGNLNDAEAGVFPAIWNILRNAFIESFRKQTEGTIDFGSEEENEK